MNISAGRRVYFLPFSGQRFIPSVHKLHALPPMFVERWHDRRGLLSYHQPSSRTQLSPRTHFIFYCSAVNA